jgi:phosphopantothenoylcysteine synthetase/decarboxylase
MMLPLIVLVILTIVLVMAYQNTKKNDKVTKGFLILSYLIILGICFKYGIIQNKLLLEGFEVEIPDTDDIIENNSENVKSEDEDEDEDEAEDEAELENILDDMEEDEDIDEDEDVKTEESISSTDTKKISI